jgi:hypothetical protein
MFAAISRARLMAAMRSSPSIVGSRKAEKSALPSTTGLFQRLKTQEDQWRSPRALLPRLRDGPHCAIQRQTQFASKAAIGPLAPAARPRLDSRESAHGHMPRPANPHGMIAFSRTMDCLGLYASGARVRLGDGKSLAPHFGARLARMRWRVRRCMLSFRAVSDTLRALSS